MVVTSGGRSTTSSAATLRVIMPQQLLAPQRAADGQFQVLFAALSRFQGHHTTNFIGASTVWVTNSGSFTPSNRKIFFDDAGGASAPAVFTG